MPDKRILLIEDEADYVRLINRVLDTGEQTFEVKPAPDLVGGLASLKEHLPEPIRTRPVRRWCCFIPALPTASSTWSSLNDWRWI